VVWCGVEETFDAGATEVGEWNGVGIGVSIGSGRSSTTGWRSESGMSGEGACVSAGPMDWGSIANLRGEILG